MKDYDVYKEPVKEPEKGPSAEELSAQREIQHQTELKQREIETARAQAKAEAMERFVQESFARGRQAPPEDAVRAQQELGLTEEQILQDPTGAIAQLSEHIRLQNEAMQDYQQRANVVIGSLAKNNFKSEMQSLAKERFGEWLGPYVEDYFRRNPQEAFQDGAVKRVYNELVGQNLEELERLNKERVALPQTGRERVIEAPIGYSSAPEPPRRDKQELPEDEAFMLQAHNNRVEERYRMTPEEWKEIRSGRKYPKKISTDIQYRGAKPNVSY